MDLNKPTATCDPGLLNRYLDGELEHNEIKTIQDHVALCEDCREVLKRNRLFAGALKSAVAREQSGINFDALATRVLMQRSRRPSDWKIRLLERVRLKRFYIPAVSFATAMILFFVVYTPETVPTSPSAIITSFSGEISSVTIMETPNNRQTILWFNEISADNGKAHGSQNS